MSSIDKMSPYSFRIVALRTLSCEEYYQDLIVTKRVRKALLPDTTYFFYNDYIDKYDDNGEWIGIEKSAKSKRVGEGFFSICKEESNEHEPAVSISAIVGENGCGKSSLIEYVIRIINNFAYKEGFAFRQDSLTYVNNVYGTLFYEIGDILHFIRCDGENIVTSQDISFENKRELGENLFFTIVSNYALYSYNSLDFFKEVEEDSDYCWIDGIFHKNDSYQTPITINPHRINGNIDVNKEKDLCRQRLLTIFTESESNRHINGDKYASGFAFNLEGESKFNKQTIEKCFKDIANINALLSENRNYGEYIERRDKGENLAHWTNQYELDSQINFWLRYEKLWDSYRSLFTIAVNIDKKFKNYQIEESANSSDIKVYLELFPAVVDRFITDKVKYKRVYNSMDSLSKICERLNSLEIQRLVLIIDLCELWEKKLGFKTHFFTHAFKYQTSDKDHALLYLIYKTISVFAKYEPFNKIIDVAPKAFMPFIGKVEQNGRAYDWFDTIEECFNLLFNDEDNNRLKDSYEFLKLRQTVNFLTKESFKKGNHDVYTDRDFGYYFHVSFDNLHEQIERAKTQSGESAISLLPPPIYVGEILVRDQNETRYKFSDLSSGEQQMLYSLSGIVYHLRNLNFHLNDNNKVFYSYVNVILEEVELYFHPEFQRDYIRNLLHYIYSSGLDNIKAINIMCVTHSPFILSDIPKNNVLFLKEGRPCYKMQENTFGANIHSMLKNAFFLGTPIGGFAQEKINGMFERLHNHEYDDQLYEEIKYVSEPLLKSQLIQMYSLNRLPYGNEEMESLKKRIKELEDKLNG